MKILVDTNIILDVVLERQPFVEQAIQLLETTQQANITLYVTATTITDLYYIIRRAKDRTTALSFIEDLLQLMEIASVDETVIKEALRSDIRDFEDAIQESAAKRQIIQGIVTRNETDFDNSTLKIYNPESFLRDLQLSH